MKDGDIRQHPRQAKRMSEPPSDSKRLLAMLQGLLLISQTPAGDAAITEATYSWILTISHSESVVLSAIVQRGSLVKLLESRSQLSKKKQAAACGPLRLDLQGRLLEIIGKLYELC